MEELGQVCLTSKEGNKYKVVKEKCGEDKDDNENAIVNSNKTPREYACKLYGSNFISIGFFHRRFLVKSKKKRFSGKEFFLKMLINVLKGVSFFAL